jgi:hypothetical protein
MNFLRAIISSHPKQTRQRTIECLVYLNIGLANLQRLFCEVLDFEDARTI